MEYTGSDIFGEMKYIYGWVKPSEITMGGEKYNILIEAVSKQYQDITPEQEEGYKDYTDHADIYSKELEKALTSTPSMMDGKFKPIGVRFERDGSFGFVLESTIDGSVKCFYKLKPNPGFEDLLVV